MDILRRSGVIAVIMSSMFVFSGCLGFGGGDAAALIHKINPKAKITGIEKDEALVKVYHKYFGKKYPLVKKLHFILMKKMGIYMPVHIKNLYLIKK